MKSAVMAIALGSLLIGAACSGNDHRGPSGHVIEIDIDDHGLAGLWMASAPNLKGLIARGTLAFSRVVVPTHSNQNNITLLTGQYPEGHDVPANDWLSRGAGWVSPVSIPGLELGDYALYAKNPLLTRGDSVYRAVQAAGGRSAYVGQLPTFEAGADDVHLAMVGLHVGPYTLDPPSGKALLQSVLGYPTAVIDGYHFDGPPDGAESPLHFTLRDAAEYVRATSADHPMPAYMFVWDFIALDDDPTATYGADGPELAAIIGDYDDGLGDLLAALAEKQLLDDTNILFTLDHGKVNTHKQAALGTHGGGAGAAADGQLATLIAGQGAAAGLGLSDYAVVNEDGDALVYAKVDGAGTPAGAAAQADVSHKLLALIQDAARSGALAGVDPTRTLTADGALGTRAFHSFRNNSPNQADIVLFPLDDWTLNQVDPDNAAPGPFQEHDQRPYGRHGGFSVDELYVPLIMAGPAFKQGVLLPHPVEHADVAPTALAALAGVPAPLRTAARGPIHAALVGDAGETIPLPTAPEGARDLVLAAAGFGGPVAPPANPAQSVVVIDLGGVYDDELFSDGALADAAAPLRALAAAGTRFEDCWTRSRDWAVNEYQMLTGGYPVAPYVSSAEDDPAEVIAPGAGLLAMPPPPLGQIANRAGYDAWRSQSVFANESLFTAAHANGMTTALLGDADFHLLHLDPATVDVVQPGTGDPASLGDALAALAAANPKFLAVVAAGGPRVADRHSPAAISELAHLAAAAADVAARLPNAMVVLTGRGASPIEDPGADFYGPGSSRHVPLVVIGPGARAGVVSGQPAAPADIPATILYALGLPTSTDFAQGTWATGTPVGGISQPLPASAADGHVLLRAFAATPSP